MILNLNDFQVPVETSTQLPTGQLPLKCLIVITHLPHPN